MKNMILAGLFSVISLLSNQTTPAPTNTTTTQVVNYVENQNLIDVGEISKFAINNNNIYFLNDSFNKYDVSNNSSIVLNYENVTEVKQTQNYVALKTNNQVKIFKNGTEILIPNLTITCSIFNIYEKDNNLFISYVNNNQLNFIKVNSNNEVIINYNSEISTVNPITLCLNEDFTYVISQNNTKFRLIKFKNAFSFPSSEITFNHLNCSAIEIMEQNQQTYFVLTTNLNHKLVIAKENITNASLDNVFEKEVSGTSHESFSLGEVSHISDVKFYNNLIYIADKTNKSLQTFVFNGEELTPNQIVLASNCYENGYFYGVNDFEIVNENKILISDTFNNRIQVIENNQINVISNYLTTSLNSPKFVTTNNNLDYWFYSNNKLVMLNQNEIKEYNVEQISDVAINSNNQVYFLNFKTNCIQTIKDNNILTLKDNLPINQNSKLLVLNNSNYVITTNNNVYLLDSEFNILGTALTIDDNILSITADFYNNIYILSNNITKVSLNNNQLQKQSILNFDSSNLSSINLNKETGELFAYDQVNSCFLKIVNNSFFTKIENFKHAVNTLTSEPLSQIITFGTVNNVCYLSNYPNNVGISYKLNINEKVYVLAEVNNSYYVMFNNNNTIKYGYVLKDYLTITQATNQTPTKYVVIGKNVKLYKYPTTLRDSNTSFAYSQVELNSVLDIVNLNLISLDNSQYFAVLTPENKILYVNASDVILYGSVDIISLPDLNAEIITANNEKINLYTTDNTSSEILLQLNEKQKIYVKDFNIDSKFTYVTVITSNKETVSGYVETKYIKLSNNNPNLTSAYIILGVTLVIIITTIILYFVFKKNDNNIN